MRRTIGFVAAALLLGQAALALAQEQTFFGPAQYDHVSAGANYATDTFTVPDNVAAPFTLRVTNGGDDARTRVDAAWIFLNGALVAGAEDIHRGTSQFGRSVRLQPQNRLVVIMLGRAGTHLAVSVSGQLVPPALVSLTPVNATVTLGASTALSLRMAPAQATDTVVAIEVTPTGIVSAPASVTVPAGQTAVDVPVGTIAFGQAGVTARLNGSSASALVNVVPQSLQVVSIVPSAARMNVGATSAFTVNINAVQDADREIALSVDVPGVLQLPATATVARGTTSATFMATALAIGDVIVTAAANGTQQTASVHVSPEPAAIVSLLPSPLALQEGATGNLTVTINVAQEADTTITIANDAPAVAGVADSVTIPAGSVSAAVGVTALASGGANVTASVNGTSATAAIQVSPPPPVVTEIAPAALTLAKGRPGTLTARVSRAPSVLTAVTLVSSAPAVASVPQVVNVPAGATSVDFPVASNGEGQAQITASLNGGSASATVTVTPAELASLTLSPQSPAVNVGQTVAFTATGTMTDGTTQDFTTRVSWFTSDTSASIDATGLATANLPGTPTITAFFNFIPAGATLPVSVSQSTTLTILQPAPPPGFLTLLLPNGIAAGVNGGGSVLSSVPAPAGGLLVTLTVTGPAPLNNPPSVLVPAGATSAFFGFLASVPGTYQIVASAPNSAPALFTLTVVPGLTITSISPTSGAPGTLVTISGGPFDPVLSNNTVVFTFDVIAPVISATPTQLVVSVPAGAVTGPITVNVLGFGPTHSATFTVPPPPTHAHVTDRTARPSSPVTPFVLGANPGDAFSFLVMGPPTNGTASVIGNRLVYTSNAGFTGIDQFAYRVVKGDGSTLDATARVRVFGGTTALTNCTRNSTTATNPDGSVTLNRTVATPCTFYAETVTRLTATGAATVKYLVARPSLGTAPKAALFLIGGSDLDMSIAGNAVSGLPTSSGGNFLVRAMQIFAEAGYLAIAMQRPSDLPPPGSTNPLADIDQYRISVNHAVDILAVLREENTDNLPVFIAGTSRGAMSVVANNMIATGISISSPVTRGSSGNPALVFVNDPRYPSLQPAFVQRPAHVLWNTDDQCSLTQPVDTQALFDNLVAAGVTAASDAVSGGFSFDTGVAGNDPICGGLSFHQFLGIEATLASGLAGSGAAPRITAWLDGRIAALGADRHPDAAFAALSTASGTPLQVDLATLARDVDGDALSYALSHATTSRGGSVTLSGSTVTYTPPAGVANATDYFVYVVTDGRGGVGAAVITVNVGG